MSGNCTLENAVTNYTLKKKQSTVLKIKNDENQKSKDNNTQNKNSKEDSEVNGA